MSVTVDSFLSRVERRISFPANQATLSETNILIMADDVMREQLIPLILSVNQNYFVTTATQALTDAVDTYDIPYRSIGRTLRDMKLQNGSVTSVSNLVLYDLEDVHMFGSTGAPAGFYFEGDKYVIVPSPNGSQYSTLLWYDLRPSEFVKLDECGKVASIASDVVTVETLPAGLIAGTTIDFVQGKSGSSILSMDIDITSVSDPTITFATDAVPSTLVAGDYIAVAGKTPVIQIPEELIGLLTLWTGARILYSISDYEGEAGLLKQAAMLEKNAKQILSPRIQGETRKVVNRNGLLRGKGFNSSRQTIRGGYYP